MKKQTLVFELPLLLTSTDINHKLFFGRQTFGELIVSYFMFYLFALLFFDASAICFLDFLLFGLVFILVLEQQMIKVLA